MNIEEKKRFVIRKNVQKRIGALSLVKIDLGVKKEKSGAKDAADAIEVKEPKRRSLRKRTPRTPGGGPEAVLAKDVVTYEIFEGASQQGKDLMVDSVGYSYSLRQTHHTTRRKRWVCCIRNAHCNCTAMLHQDGDQIIPGRSKHIHPPEPNLRNKIRLRSQVMSRVASDLDVPVIDIVEETLKEEQDRLTESLPSASNLYKAADRLRKKVTGYKPEKVVKIEDRVEDGELVEDGQLLLAGDRVMRVPRVIAPVLIAPAPDLTQAETAVTGENTPAVVTVTTQDGDQGATEGETAAATATISSPPSMIQYEIIKGATTRGRDKLLDSLGYTYNFKRRCGNATTWLCGTRNTRMCCQANVIQKGTKMYRGKQDHIHPPNPAANRKLKNMQQLKTLLASGDRSVKDIIRDIVPGADGQKVSGQPEVVRQRENLRRNFNKLRKKLSTPHPEMELTGEVVIEPSTDAELAEAASAADQHMEAADLPGQDPQGQEIQAQEIQAQEIQAQELQDQIQAQIQVEGAVPQVASIGGQQYEIRTEDMQQLNIDPQLLSEAEDGTIYVYMN